MWRLGTQKQLGMMMAEWSLLQLEGRRNRADATPRPACSVGYCLCRPRHLPCPSTC